MNVNHVSIHAPAWGATQLHKYSNTDIEVSIHAPAWGATGKQQRRGNDRTRFNPRTRMGCDGLCRRPSATRCMFQSTHPHGVRQEYAIGMEASYCVSIHAPAWGATLYKDLIKQRALVSIHAPAWGATRNFTTFYRLGWFQSTHPHGVRRYHRRYSG